MRRWAYVAVALSGAGMALALALAGITRPEVIIGSFDFFGRWDPTLWICFAFAVPAYHLFYRVARRRAQAGTGPALALPTSKAVDARLVIGASIFGVGWGFGGVCPGPGVTSLGAGASWAAVYVAAVAVGVLLADSRGFSRLPRLATRP